MQWMLQLKEIVGFELGINYGVLKSTWTAEVVFLWKLEQGRIWSRDNSSSHILVFLAVNSLFLTPAKNKNFKQTDLILYMDYFGV